MKTQHRKRDEHVTDLLSAWMDGALSADQAAEVGRHLDQCPACRKEHAALAAVDRLLKEVPEISPSPDFSRNFWKKLDAAQSRRGRITRFFETFFNSWRPALAAAAALVVLGAGSVLLYRAGEKKNDSAMPVIAENMQFYADYELLENLELFENWEAVISMEEI